MDELKNRAAEIRDEKKIAANTANRVGGFLIDLINRISEKFQIKLGKSHNVNVEMIDYESSPTASLTFENEKINLKLQIPRGKSGEDAPIPTINDEGNWTVDDQVLGPSVTVDYEIVATPDKPEANYQGVVLDGTPIEIKCYKKSPFGPRILLDDSTMSIQAQYVIQDSSGERVLSTQKKEIRNPITFPVQYSGNNVLRVSMLDQKSNVLKVKDIIYNKQGAPGTPGATFKPIWKDNGILGFESVQMDGDVTIKDTPVIPSISINGNWTIGGVETEFPADVTPAINASTAAVNTANSAIQKAQEAQTASAYALSTATTAQSTATTAKETADAAINTATAAQSKANEAATTATTAQSTANTAKTTADAAKTAATTAQSTANTAKTTADAAKTAATTAQSTANTAKTTAEKAKILAVPSNVINYNTGMCYSPQITDEEYLIINVKGSGDFCIAHTLTQQDKICYVSIKNNNTIGGSTITVTMPTGTGYYAPGTSFDLKPQQVREISYLKSSLTSLTYISWGQTLTQYL